MSRGSEYQCGRVIVLGGSGTVGTQISLQARQEGHQVTPTSTLGNEPNQKFDALRNSVSDIIEDLGVGDVVFLLCALTDPDAVCRDVGTARRLNVDASIRLAKEIDAAGARLVFVSSEFVYDGNRGGYVETDAPTPETMYGKYKVEVETQILSFALEALVIRTGAVVSPRVGENCLVEKMWRALQQRDVRIAEDNLISLTPLEDVAVNIFQLLRAGASGLWHVVHNPPLSRVELAQAVIEASCLQLNTDFNLCQLNDLPYPERRPPNSWLSGEAAKKKFGLRFRDLRQAIAAKVRLLESAPERV